MQVNIPDGARRLKSSPYNENAMASLLGETWLGTSNEGINNLKAQIIESAADGCSAIV